MEPNMETINPNLGDANAIAELAKKREDEMTLAKILKDERLAKLNKLAEEGKIVLTPEESENL